MANINLLPWREELRKEKTRQFTSMLGFSVILTVAVAIDIIFALPDATEIGVNQHIDGRGIQIDQPDRSIGDDIRDLLNP